MEDSYTVQLTPQAINSGWQSLVEHLEHWYCSPDLQALQIALACAHAHHYEQSDPLGLFVVGPSGSGKTSIIVRCLLALAGTRMMGDLSTKSFITAKKGSRGVLQQLGSSGILVFKDLTTLLSKREVDRAEIITQLREIMDGSWQRDTGEICQTWTGKASCIGACTHALERAWSVHRDLGERFISVRLPSSPDPIAVARAARAQNGHEKWIADEMQRLAVLTFGRPLSAPANAIPDEYQERIYHLAHITAILRAHVIRQDKQIVDIPPREELSRLPKHIALISQGHSDLFCDGYGNASFEVAQRLAYDSCPMTRCHIFKSITFEGEISAYEIHKQLGVPYATVRWHAEELQALGVIELSGGDMAILKLTNTFRDTIKKTTGNELPGVSN